MPKAKSDVHITPDRVFDMIKSRWGYSKKELFDPCPVNPDFDGLKIDWKDRNFVNPPYTLLKEFVYKAVWETTINDKMSILLLPAKTDQEWFHYLLEVKGYDIMWIRNRLKFKNNEHHATQPHFLVKI